ncbi:MAG: hypothetical protein EU548_07615, partial [Promethearchaeota archaeon]
MFLKGKELLTLYNKSDEQEVLDLIDNFWDRREDQESYFENGLYEILAHIFKKTRKEYIKYQVIVLSDRPSYQSEDYHSALYNLVLKASNFSTYIDVIRIGSVEAIGDKFMGDEVKLKVITSETVGGLFYCEHGKKLAGVLESLVKDKKQYNIVKTTKSQVKKEDKSFYEKLAAELISLSEEDDHVCILCQEEKCPVCNESSDELHKCYNCNAAYHKCCITRYSFAENVGFNHIFRCIQCQTLLKLDEENVNRFIEDLKPIIEEPIQQNSEENIPLEFNEEEQFQNAEILEEELIEKEYESKKEAPSEKKAEKKVKVGGFFGTEITIETTNSGKRIIKKKQKSKSQEIYDQGTPKLKS